MNAIARLLARGALPLSLFALAAAAQDPAEENKVLRERLAAAEQRIDKLEQEGASKDRAALETAVDDYLKTTKARTAASTPLAGYGPVPFRNGCGCAESEVKGFYLRDESGDFLLRLSGQLQIRFVANEQEDSLGDPHLYGFEIPRAKLVASGNVLSPQWTYKIQGNFDINGGGMTLEDCWVTYYASAWSFTAGQFKCPVLREEIVDSAYQLCVERSVVNDALTSGERLTGVAAGYAKETWRVLGAFTDGDSFPNTPALVADTDYAITFRGELLLKGNFSLFDTFTSFRDEAPGIMLGLGFHTQQGETGTPGASTVVYVVSFDASFEFGGSNLFVQATWEDLDMGDVDGPRNPFGIVVQGGHFVTDKVELFARYEYGDLDTLVPPDTIDILTIGANWYVDRQQRVKLTGDFGYAFDAVPVTQKYTDYRRDVPFAKGQIVVRLQLQLLF